MKTQSIANKYNDFKEKIKILEDDLYKISDTYDEVFWKNHKSPSVNVLYDYLTVVIEESKEFESILWDKKDDPKSKSAIDIINLYLDDLITEKNSCKDKKNRTTIVQEKIDLLNEILEDIDIDE